MRTKHIGHTEKPELTLLSRRPCGNALADLYRAEHALQDTFMAVMERLARGHTDLRAGGFCS